MSTVWQKCRLLFGQTAVKRETLVSQALLSCTDGKPPNSKNFSTRRSEKKKLLSNPNPTGGDKNKIIVLCLLSGSKLIYASSETPTSELE